MRIYDRHQRPFDRMFPTNDQKECRLCCKKLTGRRTSWCSQRCSDRAFGLVSMWRGSTNHIRLYVYERDYGICCRCGVDAEKLRRILTSAFNSLTTIYGISEDAAVQLLKKYTGYIAAQRKAYDGIVPYNPLWQADHIVEVADGGDHALENFQTLCTKCHSAKTTASGKKRKSSNT